MTTPSHGVRTPSVADRRGSESNTTAPPSSQPRHPAWAVAILLIAGFGYVIVFLGAMWNADDELLQGLVVAPILFAASIPIALRIARRERDGTLATIVLAGAALKLVICYVQFKISYGYYAGRVDAQLYHNTGQQLAPAFRRFDFSTDIGALVGTGYTKITTGLVYAIFGTSRITGFMVFGWIGFLGLVLLANAFRVGIPLGSFRRYLIAVLFLPSLLYWPSTIGKEALMLLGIGLAAYGAAMIFRRRPAGILPFGGGIFVLLLIRPHMALIVFAGLAFAFLVRKAPARTYAAPLFRMLGIGVLVVLAFFIMSRTSAYLDRSLKTSSLSEQLDKTSERTSEAGSSFTPATVRTPLDIPWATVTVLFRPFPFETNNLPGLLSALEGLILAALLVTSADRIRSIPRLYRTTPYLAFSLAYLMTFIVAFSRFANFGLLARQRVQAIPFLLVLIALPKLRDLVATTDADDASTPAAGVEPTRVIGTTGVRRRLRPVRDRTPVSSGTGFGPPSRATG